MELKRVAVFGATGTQGSAQLLELKRQRLQPVAVCRNPGTLVAPEFEGIERISAAYDDPVTLARALNNVDAVFFQAPALGENSRLLRWCATLAETIRGSNVSLTVVNSSMWAPDQPCGEGVYDGVLAMEQVFVESGIPLIVFRPTLFMNNLLGSWIRSQIVDEGVYHYPHKAAMRANWISLEDVARFMIAALSRPELAGRKIRIGGPENLTTLQMLDIISRVIGRDVRHQFMTPREFGEYFWNFFGPSSGLDRDTYVAGWESFYNFNNDSKQRPFEADPAEALELLPIEMTTLADWAKAQKWN